MSELKTAPLPDDMTMIDVVSSNIASYGYSPSRSLLRVVFKNAVTWEYDNVPQSVINDLQVASSVGSYFSRYIKTTFSGHQVAT